MLQEDQKEKPINRNGDYAESKENKGKRWYARSHWVWYVAFPLMMILISMMKDEISSYDSTEVWLFLTTVALITSGVGLVDKGKIFGQKVVVFVGNFFHSVSSGLLGLIGKRWILPYTRIIIVVEILGVITCIVVLFLLNKKK